VQDGIGVKQLHMVTEMARAAGEPISQPQFVSCLRSYGL
jgi:hypothetical protein